MNIYADKNQAFNLNKVNPEQINDVLQQIERSFHINMDDTSINDVKTFGNLCDVVVEKVKKNSDDSCTTTRAFYKLRNAITASGGFDKEQIKPQTRLTDLFPRDGRIEAVAAIEDEMGFEIKLLQPKQWVISLFAVILIAACIMLFYDRVIGVLGILFAFSGFKIADRFGKEMQVKTIGDLAQKIAREHHLKCRREASAVNKTQVSQKIVQMFVADVNLRSSELNRG